MAETPHYLLDTHIWFWLVRGREGRLAPTTAVRLEHAALRAPLGVSVISVWEIALLARKGRISLEMPVTEWIESALDRPGFVLADLDAGIAIESCSLPGAFHADPADRFLVATARFINAIIVTRDQRILKYGKQGHLKVMAA